MSVRGRDAGRFVGEAQRAVAREVKMPARLLHRVERAAGCVVKHSLGLFRFSQGAHPACFPLI
jgi:hypothetical protein